MGGGEAGTASSKPDKTPVQEHNGVQQYPDWATMQATYYPPGIMPPHYFGTTTVASGHAPHHPYMWGPQPMMSPFGTPYPAIYPHGGVYPHPSSSPAAAQEKSNKTPNSGKDQVQVKKLKGPDGSASNGRDKNDTRSQSSEDGTEGSSDGSDGNNGKQNRGKLVLEGSAAVGARVSNAVKPNMAGPLALSGNNPTTPGRDGVHSELWVQKGFPQDERELKRERRKQSNRESARRSRLRKQAETEELAEKVEALKAENLALKTEISRLSDNSAKLRQENAALLDKLNNTQASRKPESSADKAEPVTPASSRGETENFLSKINDQTENAGKLQQLLESTNPQVDAVVAG